MLRTTQDHQDDQRGRTWNTHTGHTHTRRSRILVTRSRQNGILIMSLVRERIFVGEAEASEPAVTSLFELRLAVARMHDCEAGGDNAAMGPHDSAARRSAPAGGASGGIALVSTASDTTRAERR